MSDELVKRLLQIAFWIMVVAVPLLLLLEKGTAEYVITLFSLLIGIIFLVIALVIHKINNR